MSYKGIDNALAVLGKYINYHKTKDKTMKGSGITKRNQKGGNVMFLMT